MTSYDAAMSTDPEPAGSSAAPSQVPAATAAKAPAYVVSADGPARAWQPDDPAFEAKVIRAFIRDGRLTSIPARDRKKLVVYRFLVDRVLPDPAEEVAERDLNMRLALWHPDVATIRRALVDHRLATREGMTYRRSIAAPRGSVK